MADDARAGDAAQFLCRGDELVERGRALLFDVVWRGEPMRAFALRFEGRAVAYLNRCVHVPSELDWLPGEFLDAERRYIVCAVHGATYEPANGRCVGGPCGRARLTEVALEERADGVYWYPSAALRPPQFDDHDAAAASGRPR
ncbi:Rieske 2Fe-2S domain-containing protein [Azohydromonas sp.]|uniref:Rieske (2Fe-2S) protein n=1 Tax=Azohydromonas sp. TaxID=1872666 RepID=UPI002CE9083B|nr:Rieske 2Fe-2S domain-containing protein [Azohydromonas sp.]HMM85541.1 Rieske 2Fe-2S domain-containing protein [Azohydromonas sp.]